MDRPIGIFDSGLGGLTVAHELVSSMNYESVYYVGDTKRCPYGPRSQEEVQTFVKEVGAWLCHKGAKLIIIACNTATAAGLEALQQVSPVPVLGVIDAGAQGAVEATKTGRIGVIATEGTCKSRSYVRAIHRFNPNCEVVQVSAAPFVQIVESELASGEHFHQDWDENPDIFMTDEIFDTVQKIVEPLKADDVDTVVLGCTHFPLLAPVIQRALGPDVQLINPARIAVAQAKEILTKTDQLAPSGKKPGIDGLPMYQFATTSDDIVSFAMAAQFVFAQEIDSVEHIEIEELEAMLKYPDQACKA